MTRFPSLLPRCLGLLLLCVGLAATAQQNDPPGRVARLNVHEGTVSFAPAGDDQWYDVAPNRPLTAGDRLWTDRNARAELNIGPATLRLDDQTQVELTELGDDAVRFTTQQGSLQLRVRPEAAGTRFEIDTGNLAVVIDQPGEYRIDSDPAAGTTWIGVNDGNATLYGANGQSQPLGAHQQLMVSGRDLAVVRGAQMPPSVSFDRWVAERDRLEDQSISARYVSRDMVGYQQLDNYGDWQNDGTYGSVWYPRGVAGDWAPYQDGQWVDVAPWGPTWVDAAPWGFAPFHYGRWARIGPRWGWVPGRVNARPVYSPAMVGFVGGNGGGIPIGGGRNGVGWFPLAPGEAWRPGFRASQRYVDQVNRGAVFGAPGRPPGLRNDNFMNQGLPGAMTVVPADRFGRGLIGRRDRVPMPQGGFGPLPVVPTPGLSADRHPFSAAGRPGFVPPAGMARPQPQAPQANIEAIRQLQEQQRANQQQPQPLRQRPQFQPPLQGQDPGRDALRQQMEIQQRLAGQQQQQQQNAVRQQQMQQQLQQMQQQSAQQQQQRAMQGQQQMQQQQMQMLQRQQQQAIQPRPAQQVPQMAPQPAPQPGRQQSQFEAIQRRLQEQRGTQ